MTLEGGDLCFPQLLNESCRRPKPPHSEAVLLDFVLYTISMITAVLNLLVIISISHFRQLHTPTNLILLSLAVSDFLVGLVAMPVELSLLTHCWMLSDLMCSLYYLLLITVSAASAGNMVLICIDRYVAICDPLHYPTKINHKVVAIGIFLCWSCSFLYSTFLLFDNLKHPGKFNSCHGECLVNITGAVDLALAFIIPITVIIVLYMRVFLTAVSQARAMNAHVTAVSFKTVKVRKSEIKAATTLGIVVVTFLICYSPYYCVSLTGSDTLVGSSTEVFMIFVLYLNSCLNPVIYALFYPWFRKAVRIIVTLQIQQIHSREANLL